MPQRITERLTGCLRYACAKQAVNCSRRTKKAVLVTLFWRPTYETETEVAPEGAHSKDAHWLRTPPRISWGLQTKLCATKTPNRPSAFRLSISTPSYLTPNMVQHANKAWHLGPRRLALSRRALSFFIDLSGCCSVPSWLGWRTYWQAVDNVKMRPGKNEYFLIPLVQRGKDNRVIAKIPWA